MSGRVTLHQAVCAKASPEQAAKVLGAKGWALLMTPGCCELARVRGDGTVEASGGPVDLSTIYEARFFNAAREVRWMREGAAIGRAVVLSEGKLQVSEEWQESSGDEPLDCFEDQFLLWGQRDGEPSGDWTRFSTSRIGTLHVPEAIHTRYAVLTQRSYFTSRAEDDGNLVFAASRLTGLTGQKASRGTRT